MVSRDTGKQSLKQDLSLLGTAFLLMEHGPSGNCLPQGRMRELAADPDSIDPTTWHHFGQCERCSHTFRAFRGLRCIELLPPAWRVALKSDGLAPPDSDLEWQYFGYVSLESGAVRWCDEDDWLYSPLELRITVVVDKPADFVGLTVADVPSAITGAVLLVSDHRTLLDRDDALDILQAMESLTALMDEDDLDEAGDAFIASLFDGQVSLEFAVATESGGGKTSVASAILRELAETGAIERDFDYELPSGLHCDAHVNVGRLCRSEETLQRVAAAFDGLFADCVFDTILTNGWAMATIARRISALRAHRGDFIDDVICDGYHQLLLAGDILPESRVLVLIDVHVTGALVERLQESVRSAGATVAGIGCLVEALWSGSQRRDQLRSLCAIGMDIVDPTNGSCRRCGVLSPRVFNPVSQCMTQRAPHPRSPSEFLAENAEAREFWRLVDLARAYEHHRKEENTHYIAFVDTRKMLEHEEVGPTIVRRLSERISNTMRPEVLLVPNRVRGQILAKLLASSLSSPSEVVRVIAARRMQRRGEQIFCSRPWFIRPDDLDLISGRRVLVVDAAAGHGTTIDRLAQLAVTCGATSVGAAVVISRLTETCEQAFAARLPAGFAWLYHLPIRPVLIRGENDNLCPICQRRAALEQVAEASGVDAIQRWTQHLKRRGRRSVPSTQSNRDREVQLALFPIGEQFFESCRESVASGVTLHALNAAMTNGMAPLTLPELFNSRIPTRSRTAMVENLPQGVVEWSGEVLADDLREFLHKGTAPNVWRASAEVLVKDGANDWMLQVDELLGRLHQQKARTSATFWNHLACTAYIAVTQNPTLTHAVRERLSQFAKTSTGTTDTEGVRRVLDALPD